MIEPTPTATPPRPSIRPLDWLMLVLALVSIGLLCWETWGGVTETQRTWIFRIDYAVCAIFAAEFLWRWKQEGWQRGFVLRPLNDVAPTLDVPGVGRVEELLKKLPDDGIAAVVTA